MLIFLYGADTFRAREKLRELKKQFLQKNGGKEYLITSFNEDSFDLALFRHRVLSSGFFTEKKMVIVRNVFLAKRKDEKEILEIIKKIPEETALVFWETSDEANFIKSPLFEYLIKGKYVFKFSPLKDNNLIFWIREQAKLYGASINNMAASLIADILGNDLVKIDLELQKLASYAGEGGTIKENIVKKLLAREAEENIFKLLDAVAAKNKRLALVRLKDELFSGKKGIEILGALARQTRILLQAKILKNTRKLDKSALSKELAIHPYVAQKALIAEKHFHLNELKNLYRRLAQIDIVIKTSSAPAETLLGLMIAKL